MTELADTTTGFDPTDPDVMRTRVPHEELLTLRRSAPGSFVEEPAAAPARTNPLNKTRHYNFFPPPNMAATVGASY